MDSLTRSPWQAPEQISLTQQHWEQMLDDAAMRAPQEACGLLAGQIAGSAYRAVRVIPTTNVLHSPVRYRMDPYEQLAAFEQMEALELELVGIYHSHPQGPPTPSATDLAEAYYPDAVYLIWCGNNGKWECNGFHLQSGQVNPVAVRIEA